LITRKEVELNEIFRFDKFFIITQDILGSIDLSVITISKHHLAPKYYGAATLEVAPPPSFMDPVS
jgi:hypothetical protein